MHFHKQKAGCPTLARSVRKGGNSCSLSRGIFSAIVLLGAITLTSACRIDMHVQPRQNPLARSDFYADQRSARPPVEGTIARGQLHEDTYFYTGKIGNNPGDGSFDMRISIYTPPYLFHGARPVITGLQSNKAWTYGKSYKITTNAPIKSAVLIRPAAVTHQSDPNQREILLPISGTGTKLSLNLTSNANIAPPGWYMLFVNNANGVPSVAKWVHVG